MSLGTFKRTFFFAAPSDPLMLQWADVLEKTKNASDGKFKMLASTYILVLVALVPLHMWGNQSKHIPMDPLM